VTGWGSEPRLIGQCGPCGKQIYADRKAARHMARKLAPRGSRPRAYECQHHEGWWHIGHLPDAVRDGQIDRDEYRSHMRGAS
jgi:hypothetical protein